jgi:hypothetical protein
MELVQNEVGSRVDRPALLMHGKGTRLTVSRLLRCDVFLTWGGSFNAGVQDCEVTSTLQRANEPVGLKGNTITD